MTPSSVGVPESRIVLGKHSGRHALESRFKALGHVLSRERLDSAYFAFLQIADRKKTVEDHDLLALLREDVSSVAATK
jgi:2-isopropylmalate synthase